MNYAESKKQINKIREEYGCKGDIIFRTAIQYIVECGQNNFKDEVWFDELINDVDERHNIAESNNKILFMTRDFEKALLECAKELSGIPPYDLLIYIQKEVWLGGDGISYQRAKELLKNVIAWELVDRCESNFALQELRKMEFDDEELEELGFGWMLENEEKEE